MPVVGATRVWAVDEILSAANMNTYLSNPIDDTAGRDGRQDLEDSLTIQDGSSGNRYIGLPKGTTGQRPTIPSGLVLLRYNTSTDEPEVGEGSSWSGFATSGVTYATLNSNGDVGTGSSQVARGNHTHSISTYGISNVEIEQYSGTTNYPTSMSFANLAPVRDIDVSFNASEVGIIVKAELFASGGTGDFDLRIVRGGSQVGDIESFQVAVGDSDMFYTWVFADSSPPNGNKTYTLQVRRTTSANAFLRLEAPFFVAIGVG